MEPISKKIIDSANAVIAWQVPTLQRVVFRRRYYSPFDSNYYYEYRREIHAEDDGTQEFEMKSAYTPSGDYIGNSRWAYALVKKRGLTRLEKRTDESGGVSLGFSLREQKWYGWSHRAIYGFGIGSTCKKGDCGYVPATPEELFAETAEPDGDGHAWQKPERVHIVDEPGRRGIEITHPMTRHTTVSEDGELGGWVDDEPDIQFVACGRGAWTAETLEDAHQMACDFAEGVS